MNKYLVAYNVINNDGVHTDYVHKRIVRADSEEGALKKFKNPRVEMEAVVLSPVYNIKGEYYIKISDDIPELKEEER